ncbi:MULTISPECIES: DUF6114 domain-containing protein [Streptomyces]|uniref:DUF6114 domain-containing protein n=1 Tax=Streptomyces solicathayae TaxID=3081768 RepID=A0ABZ0LS14_9ACTN|nr:DUF6114 domain-containing protein [Streptomyces sp. HUAS YS2]WOX21996.1 DUF6114 domain-containing protein [Streptomyces sp. HUAS YS2]
MSAETIGSRGFTYWRLRFKAWRGNRPFWAGLLTMIGGLPIAYLPYADLRLGNMTIAMATTAGAGSLIIGVLLVTLGLTMWFQSAVRVFAGIAAIILALVSIPVANLGGFGIGLICALIGGGLSVAWVPGVPADETEASQAAPAAQPAPVAEAAPAAAVTMIKPLAVPEQRATDESAAPNEHATETTIDANGGRNSAG